MALFRFMWLRRFIRRHTKEIPYTTADTWKKRLSVIYMLVAWNAFGVVCYSIYQGKGDWAKYYNLKSTDELNLTPGNYFKLQVTRNFGDSFSARMGENPQHKKSYSHQHQRHKRTPIPDWWSGRGTKLNIYNLISLTRQNEYLKIRNSVLLSI